MKIILGSQSEGRRQVLEEMGYDFEIIPAHIDEKAIRDSDPKELVLKIAHAKADALQKRIQESALIITGDQVVVWNGKIREKPENEEEAERFLRSCKDYPAEIINAITVTNTETRRRVAGIDTSKVFFSEIPDDVIDKLIEEGDVFKRAGGFEIANPLLSPYVKRVEGTYDSIVGLPKEILSRLLQEAQE